jgi:hypothetical protein
LDGVDEYPDEIGISNQCVVDTLSYQSCDRWGQLIYQYLPFEDLDTQSRSLPEIDANREQTLLVAPLGTATWFSLSVGFISFDENETRFHRKSV